MLKSTKECLKKLYRVNPVLARKAAKVLGYKIRSKMKTHRIPLEYQDILVESLKQAGFNIPGIETVVKDLLTMTLPSYAQLVRYVADKYNLEDPVAEKLVSVFENALRVRVPTQEEEDTLEKFS